MENKIAEPYTESIVYALEQTVSYFRLDGAQFFHDNKTGVTIDQYALLDILYNHDGISQSELSRLALKDGANITRILNLLEQNGFVQRSVATNEKRLIKKVSITELGKSIIEQNQDVLRENFATTFNDLTPDNLADLKKILDILKQNLSKKVKNRA